MDVAAKSSQVKGSLSVGREAAVGGNASVRGSVKVGHNLKVEGMIEAQNIKCCSKGLFQTLDKLNAEYPEPKNGWWAFVGNSFPAAVYVADGGEWKATGQTGGEDLQVDITYWEDRFAGLEAEHDADMQAMEDQHNTELAAERQARENADTTEMQARVAADSVEATARQNADTTLQGNIDALEQKHDEELAALEEKHDTELQQERTDRNTAITAVRTDMNRMVGTLQDSIDALEQKHDEELAALEEKHDTELQQERTDRNTAITAVRTDMNRMVGTLQDSIDALEQKHDEELAALEEKHDTELQQEGERHDEDIEDLWAYVAPLVATMNVTPKVIRAAADGGTECVFDYDVKRKGVDVFDEAEVKFGNVVVTTRQTRKTYTPLEATEYTETLTAKHGKLTAEVQVKITAVCPTYCGAVSADFRPSESVRSLPEFLRTGKAGRYDGIDIDHGKAVIAYPASYGALSSIKDGNGYEVKDSYTEYEEYMKLGRELVMYRFYVLTEPVTANGVTMVTT